MRAVRLVAATKRILKVKFENSNLNYLVPGIFDRSVPSGEYDLDMSNPYDNTIVWIMYEIANAKTASRFSHMQHQSAMTLKWRKINLQRAASVVMLGSIPELVPAIAKGLEQLEGGGEAPVPLVETLSSLLYILGFDPHELVLRNVLFHLSTLPPTKRASLHVVFRTVFKAMYRLFDFSTNSSSGGVSVDDVADLFRLLHCTVTLWPCNVDRLWTADDLVQSMLLQLTETTPPSPPPLIDQRTQAAWVVPSTGEMQFTFEYESLPPSSGELSSNESLHNLVSAVSSGTTSQQSKAKAIQLAVCDDLYLSSEQAHQLMLHSTQSAGESKAIIEQFLPQLSSPFEACKFLTLNLSFDEILLLRVKMGMLFRVITGNASGFYSIDLSKASDVMLLNRINEINCFDKNKSVHEHPFRNTCAARHT